MASTFLRCTFERDILVESNQGDAVAHVFVLMRYDKLYWIIPYRRSTVGVVVRVAIDVLTHGVLSQSNKFTARRLKNYKTLMVVGFKEGSYGGSFTAVHREFVST